MKNTRTKKPKSKILLLTRMLLILLILTLSLTACAPACEHTNTRETVENEIDATCTHEGSYDLVTYCNDCTEKLSTVEKTTEKKEHTPSGELWENVKDSTCKESGSYDKTVRCTHCHTLISSERGEIGKKEHQSLDTKTENYKDPTCYSEGLYDEVIFCKDCDSVVYKSTKSIEKAEHTVGRVVNENVIPPSEGYDGYLEMVFYCGVCDEELLRLPLGEKPENTCTEHKDEDGNLRCDICKARLPGTGEEGYPWETTNLIFQMTRNEGGSALSSSCERYLAGEDTSHRELIDSMVSERNTKAYDSTNVSVTYRYYNNADAYGWGKCIEVIYGEVFNDSALGTPDIFCNYTYDLVGASLKGCFANLKSTLYEGENYFEFISPEYNEKLDSKGYMLDYMNSTTLSESKTYILASDYFIDLIRAFYVVPVNKGLLEEGNVGMTVTGDLDGDGVFTINDFYEEVKLKKWTYNKVAEYSALISAGNTTKTLNDRLGFAVCQMGIAPSGLFYSAGFEIVEKPSAENNYRYTYPTTHKDLNDFTVALKSLAEKPGVLVVSGSSETAGYGTTPMLAIRNRFCEGSILFGDVIQLGSLEYDEYQKLKKSSGLGVVPVPLWHEVKEGSDETYLTAIHNNARPGAIARNTRNFAQCTAFLNYQSTHSADILNYYYNFKLQYDVTDGSPGTVYMLQYIRNNVSSSLEQTTEDILNIYSSLKGAKWTQIIESANDFDVDMRKEYDRIVGDKIRYLYEFQTYFEEVLPN